MAVLWGSSLQYAELDKADYADAKELCFLLGFGEYTTGSPSRGDPRVLFDDLKRFVLCHVNITFPLDLSSIACSFLNTYGAGYRLWSIRFEGLLTLPQDQQKITELLQHLFVTLLRNSGTQTLLVQSARSVNVDKAYHGVIGTPQPDSSNIGATNSTEESRSEADQVVKHCRISEIVRPHRAPPKSVNVKGPTPPVIAPSVADLLEVIKIWLAHHPGQEAPGSLPSDLPSPDESRRLKHRGKLVFVETTDEVWVLEHAITLNLKVLILIDKDGWCMLVKAHPDNTRCLLSFHAWLGDDHGFAKPSIASTDGLSWPDIKLEDSEDDTLEVIEATEDKELTDLAVRAKSPPNSTTTSKPGKSIDICEILDSESELDEYIPKHDTSSDISDDTDERKTRQSGSQQAQRETDGSRPIQGPRTPTPPLSSLDTVKRFHWPPQHAGTPPPTPKKSKLATSSPPKPEVSVFQNLRPRTSRIDYNSLARGLPISPPTKRRSSRIGASSAPKSKKARIDSPGDRFWREKTPPRRCRINLKVTPLTPPSPHKQSKALKSTREVGPHSVILQFSLPDTTLGVISKEWEQCSTSDIFFEEATFAAGYLSRAYSRVELNFLVAVTDGDRELLAWNSKRDYERMCATIGKATRTRSEGGTLNVKIYCVRKGTEDYFNLPFFD